MGNRLGSCVPERRFCGCSCRNGVIEQAEHADRFPAIAGSDTNLPQSALFVEADAGPAACVVPRHFLVSGVAGLAGLSEVANPVVVADTVDVIDLGGTCAEGHDKSDAGHRKILAIEPDLQIAPGAFVADRLSGLPVSTGLFASDNSSIWVVLKNRCELFSVRVFDHIMPTLKGLYYGGN